jgi:hypothetical protein
VNNHSNPQQKEQCWRYHNIRLQNKATAIKTTWYWHKNKNEDKWNRMEDPDMNPHMYAHLIFDKVVKNTQ